MIDLPHQTEIVHEYLVHENKSLSSLEDNLQITDLSFYDVLAGGMCSGSSSSKADKIETSYKEDKEQV